MKKLYFIFSFFILTFFLSHNGYGQSIKKGSNSMPQKIENFSIYPNPVTNGRSYLYITTKHNFTKKIEIFDVLGKTLLSTNLSNNELNISELSKGVYILKITENNISETRKLVIK
ncbi:T9SS type A sorting domain-containing protein [Gaetbulibacter saemankumensis]|uniref:T9SS type A sorting domain-containing protein n=1 Tax=Gaetbulibacter saemankumensis TaxID=311208 RepID=UPI00041F2F1B|nr:T9SS type A sorting domain-containing protein [Gaetbulibacter saemankumensis]